MARQRAAFSSNRKNIQRAQDGIKDKLNNSFGVDSKQMSTRKNNRTNNRAEKKALNKAFKNNTNQSLGFS